MVKRFRKGYIRKVLYKKKFKLISSNRPIFKINTIYLYSNNFAIFPKRQLEKFLLYLKWFKRDQKKRFSLTPLFSVNIHPFFFSTKKSVGMRMGKGKGAKDFFFCRVPGKSLFCEVRNLLPCYLPLFIKRVRCFLHFSCVIKSSNSEFFSLQTPFFSRFFYNDKLIRHFRKRKLYAS